MKFSPIILLGGILAHVDAYPLGKAVNTVDVRGNSLLQNWKLGRFFFRAMGDDSRPLLLIPQFYARFEILNQYRLICSLDSSVTQTSFDNFHLFAQYSAASYCANNDNNSPSSISCINDVCPLVSAANAITILGFNRCFSLISQRT